MSLKIIKREAVFIPIKQIPNTLIPHIQDKLSFKFYEEKACARCDNLIDRHNDICDSCPAYVAGYDLASKVKVGANKYLKIPVGSSPTIIDYLESKGIKANIVDKSPTTKIKPVNFTGTLKPEQEVAVNTLFRKKRGILKAPPRSGKCVVGATIISTNRGLIRIDSLFPIGLSSKKESILEAPTGLKVFTRAGFCEIAHLYTKVVDETVRIQTSLGKALRGTPNHPLMVATPEGLVWKPMSEIKVGDFLVSNSQDGWGGKSNPLLGTLDSVEDRISRNTSKSNIRVGRVPKKLTKDLAKVLGYLTADGRCGPEPMISFCNSSKEKRDRFEASWNSCFPDFPLKESLDPTRTKELAVYCRYVRYFIEEQCGWELTRAGGKTIPKVLLSADRKFLLSYLAAYMSCDGEITSSFAIFSSASFRFIRQLSIVLTTLGIRNKVGTEPIEIHLAHKTAGKRIGEYGRLLIKRVDFDKLLSMFEPESFYRGELLDRGPRSLEQSNVIPFLRKILVGITDKYRVRDGQNYVYCREDNRTIPYERLIKDKRGKGRGDHLNRSLVQVDPNSEVTVVYNIQPLKFLDSELYQKVQEMVDDNITFEQVLAHEYIKEPIRVYDIEVPENNEFFGNGILCHNTVMSTALACKVGMKVLIIASQRDWLMGFQETFIGSKTQKPLTDLDTSRIKLCKTLEDFKSHDICLATIQTFYSDKGQAILAKIRDMFPVIFMDEVHTSAADKYIKIISKLNADYCIGLSGTPSRKDGKFTLVDNIVGPLAHEVRVDSMRPRIQLVKTQYQKEYKGNVPWVRMVSSIENDDKRLKLIADWVIKDVANGHMVLIPMAQVKPIAKLVDIINKKAGYKLAFPFTGSLKKEVRDETIQKAREYKIKVLVGTAKILSTGINIPRASCIFEQVLSSNLENCQQRVARVLTLMEDKPQPVIRIFLDAMNVRKNCLANEYHRVIKPKFKPVISEKDEIALNGYFKAKQQARFEI